MNVAELVDWPSAYRCLVAVAEPEARRRADWSAEHPGAFGRYGAAPLVLAALVLAEQPQIVRMVLGRTRRPGVALRTTVRVADWLIATARAIHTRVRTGADRAPLVPYVAAPSGRLLVDPALLPLPLLPLATDYARLNGGLTVEARPLAPGTAGLFVAAAGMILLDPGQRGPAWWPHELGHALDPQLRRRGDMGEIEADELFADVLGALLTEREPVTVAEAEPLVAEALAAVEAHPRYGAAPTVDALPAPGIESLAVFLSLPLAEEERAA